MAEGTGTDFLSLIRHRLQELPSLNERDVNLVFFVVSRERVKNQVYPQPERKLPLRFAAGQALELPFAELVLGPGSSEVVPRIEDGRPVFVGERNAFEIRVDDYSPARGVEKVERFIDH